MYLFLGTEHKTLPAQLKNNINHAPTITVRSEKSNNSAYNVIRSRQQSMYVCMYVKGRPFGIAMERGNRLGQWERSLSGPIFPTPRAKLARGTPPTAYCRQSAGSATNFALGLSGLPRGHRDQLGIPRPCPDNNKNHNSKAKKYNR